MDDTEITVEIILRPVCIEDSQTLLAWRNEPGTIPWMGSARELSFEEHHNWLINSLDNKNILILIIEMNTIPVGQIRYQKDTSWIENTAKVSINIAQKMHGKGIASIAFKQGSELIRKLGFAYNIFAYVRLNNLGSIKAMENAGYKRGKII